MNENMDSYLSRCLKNWTASRMPRPDGKSLLLEAVGNAPISGFEARGSFFLQLVKYFKHRSGSELNAHDYRYYSLNRNFAIQHAYRSHNEWLFGPGTKSHIWFFHIVTNSRVSA